MTNPNNKKGTIHTIYAIYDTTNDELVSVGLEYDMLEMQLQLGELDRKRFEIIEFDIKLM